MRNSVHEADRDWGCSKHGSRVLDYWGRSRAELAPLSDVADEPYTCPSCATALYEKCPSCGATRHALLPSCEHCGAAKAV